jgi:MFS family permease
MAIVSGIFMYLWIVCSGNWLAIHVRVLLWSVANAWIGINVFHQIGVVLGAICTGIAITLSAGAWRATFVILALLMFAAAYACTQGIATVTQNVVRPHRRWFKLLIDWHRVLEGYWVHTTQQSKWKVLWSPCQDPKSQGRVLVSSF